MFFNTALLVIFSVFKQNTACFCEDYLGYSHFHLPTFVFHSEMPVFSVEHRLFTHGDGNNIAISAFF